MPVGEGTLGRIINIIGEPTYVYTPPPPSFVHGVGALRGSKRWGKFVGMPHLTFVVFLFLQDGPPLNKDDRYDLVGLIIIIMVDVC